MRSEARKMLSEAEVDSSDEVVNLVVTDTAEQTKSNVEAFSNAVKKRLMKRLRLTLDNRHWLVEIHLITRLKIKPQNLAEIARQKRIIKN